MSAILRALMPCPVVVQPVPTHVCMDDSESMGRPSGSGSGRVVNRSSKHSMKLEYAGETLTVAEWALRVGMTRQAIYKRLDMGWTVDRVLGAAVRKDRRTNGR